MNHASRAGLAQTGFTLLEVLMALVFFALVGVVLQQVTASTVGQLQKIELKTLSAWIAENKLSEIRLAKSLPKARQYKEDIEFGQFDWQLVTQVKTTNNPDINRVEVEVFHITPGAGDTRKTYFMTGFVGRY